MSALTTVPASGVGSDLVILREVVVLDKPAGQGIPSSRQDRATTGESSRLRIVSRDCSELIKY